MSLFDRKKKSHDHLRTLTEKEIQDRLYGSYRPAPEGFRAETPPSKSPSSRPASFETIAESEDLFRNASTRHFPVPLKKELKESLSTVTEWVDEEADTTAKAAHLGWQESQKVARMPKKRPSLPRKPAVMPLFKTLWNQTLDLLRAIPFRSIEVRKIKIRKTGVWVSSFVALGFLMAGIHFLNVQREAAMKAPRKQEKRASAVTEATDSPLTAAVSLAESKPTPARAPEPAQPKAPLPSEGAYVIQVCTYASETDAERLSERIQEEGLSSFVKELRKASGAKAYYAVFIGRFQEYEGAKKALVEFQKSQVSKPFEDAFIRKLS